jgi:signal peptide peptidase SppA
MVGRTALITIGGTIVPHADMFTAMGLGSSVDDIARSLRTALADPAVSRIVLDIDSPGGSVFGVGELASELLAARATKPIIGIANSVAASAAYWIGSACTEFYVTPGGQVGSIGVIVAHEDVSKALEFAGRRMTLISAGRHKAEGNPYGPLGADARRFVQQQCDAYLSDFQRSVARGRGVSMDAVKSQMGEGRMLRAPAAVAARMVDGVRTLDAVLRADRSMRGQAAPRLDAPSSTAHMALQRRRLALLSA